MTVVKVIDALPELPPETPTTFAVDHLKGDLVRALVKFSADPDARALYQMFIALESIATRREHRAFVETAAQIALRRKWMEGTRE